MGLAIFAERGAQGPYRLLLADFTGLTKTVCYLVDRASDLARILTPDRQSFSLKIVN